jgi:hypothetical protein
MATRIRSVDFLPEIFRTETNKQFLNATLDQLIQEPQLKRIQGYIGRQFGSDIDDGYVVETTKNRTNYQFEPTVIFVNHQPVIIVLSIDCIIAFPHKMPF